MRKKEVKEQSLRVEAMVKHCKFSTFVSPCSDGKLISLGKVVFAE